MSALLQAIQAGIVGQTHSVTEAPFQGSQTQKEVGAHLASQVRS